MDAQDNPTPLDDRNTTLLVIAVLLRALGPNPVRISQADINEVAYCSLREQSLGDGALLLSVVPRPLSG